MVSDNPSLRALIVEMLRLADDIGLAAGRTDQEYLFVRRSIGRAPSRDIEYAAGREGALLRCQPANQACDFRRLAEAPHWNLREHVVDLLLFHLSKQLGFGRRRGDAIDEDVLGSKFLA